jgi:hypothetical protein
MFKRLSYITLLICFNTNAYSETCDTKELERLVQQPQYIQEFNNYKVLVSSKYSVWTTKVEDLFMNGELKTSDSKAEMVEIGNNFAREVANSILSFEKKLRAEPSKTCRAQLNEYIKTSLKDFKQWHVKYLLSSKLIKS